MKNGSSRAVPPTHLGGQLLRYSAIGTIGFVIDTGVLYIAIWSGMGLYSGRVVSYLVSASVNWRLNRTYTFRRAVGRHSLRQWFEYLLANIVGALMNYGAYAAMVGSMAIVRDHPVIGVAVGSVLSLAGNFLMSKYVVFRDSSP